MGSLSSLSKFQSNQTSFQTSGTSVNPLLLTLPKLESRPINVAFPPTQHLLNSTNSLPTQMVETAGLLQASTTLLGGVTTFNNDSLTIKITNVATESTNQALITNATQRQYSSPGLLSLPMSESSRSFAPSVNHLPSATSSYDGLQGPSNPATELQNEGILSTQYVAETQQSQQNRATNKKKKEIVE